jgi:hypothetical protein
MKQYPAETCNKEKHIKTKGLEDVLKTIDLNQFKCIPFDQGDFKFGGSFELS